MRSRLSIDRASRVALSAAAAVAVLAASGCSNNRVDAYRLNPTPNVDTLGQTPDEIANATTQTFDTNFRNFLETGGRFLMLDRPTRLTPKPIPY